MFPQRSKLYLNEKGLTFVELMVAIVIIGVVLIPMFSMFDFGVRTQIRGEQELVALNICQGRIESLLASYYNNERKLFVPNTITETVYQGQAYNVTNTIAVPNGRLQQLTVTVSYDSFGKEKSVWLTTKVVEY